MKSKQDNAISSVSHTQGNEIIIYQPDETLTLDVKVEDESVWLTQAQMAELFQATKQNISLHISNIYKEGELDVTSTVKEYLTVQTEGRRKVKRQLSYYNLDIIISVGSLVDANVLKYKFYDRANRNKGLLVASFYT